MGKEVYKPCVSKKGNFTCNTDKCDIGKTCTWARKNKTLKAFEFPKEI